MMKIITQAFSRTSMQKNLPKLYFLAFSPVLVYLSVLSAQKLMLKINRLIIPKLPATLKLF